MHTSSMAAQSLIFKTKVLMEHHKCMVKQRDVAGANINPIILGFLKKLSFAFIILLTITLEFRII